MSVTDFDAPAPIDLDVVLSAEWLATHIPSAVSAPISAITTVETLQTVATKVRFRVDHDDGSSRALCVKGYFARTGPPSLGVGPTEANFYSELAASLPITIPTAVYAAYDTSIPHSVIVMEDLVAGGSTFFTALSPFTVEQSAATLDEMALFHAGHWADTAGAAAMPWLFGNSAKLGTGMPIEAHQALLDDPRGEGLPAELRDAARVRRAYAALLETSGREVACLVHADAHVGNLYRTPAGGIGIIDWQLLQFNWWALDVAYHIAAALDPADRAANERRLVTHYIECLARHGVQDPPSIEAAWDGYRNALAYGYFMWSITRRVDPPITIELCRRLGRAVADHKSFDLLEKK